MNKFKQVPNKKVLAVAIASVALSGCFSDDDEAPRIQLSGGNAGDQVINDYFDWGSVGGEGGWLNVYKRTGAGNLVVTSGSVDAKFDRSNVPAEETNPSLGDVPLVITGSRTIGPVDAEPAAGVAYIGGEGYIHISDGNEVIGDEPPVTGLRVASGATLTLVPNESRYGTESNETAAIYVPVLDNRGTVRVQASNDNNDTGGLAVYANVVLSTGTIDLRGADNAESQYRRDGGRLYVNAESVFIDGQVLVSGGSVAGDNVAGHGGQVYIWSEGGQHHRGAFVANGGAAVGGEGGYGGYVALSSSGPVYNEARATLNGGDGLVGGGGGSVWIAGYGGDAWNAGAITANGGKGADGHGGDGGGIDIYARGGELRNSGSVVARGGAGGSQPYFGPEGDIDSIAGGNGGYINAYSADTNSSSMVLLSRAIGPRVPAGDLSWSGNIDLRGGSAPAGSDRWGGEGGYVGLQNLNDWGIGAFEDAEGLGSSVTLRGYGALVSNGGTGHVGGAGGGAYMSSNSVYYNGDGPEVFVLPGGIDVKLGVVANGGNAIAGGVDGQGFGGEGGGIILDAAVACCLEGNIGVAGEASVSYTGGVSAAGGSSRNSEGHAWFPDLGSIYPGHGGFMSIYGTDSATVTSAVNVSGGRDSGAAGTGGSGGRGHVESYYGAVLAKVALAGTGGYGAARAGDGGWLRVFGIDVVHDGAANVKGGNANVALAESVGGHGGNILIVGDDSSAHTGSVNYAGGVGNLGTADEGCFAVGDNEQGNCDFE